MGKVGMIAGGLVIGCAQIIAMGILLSIGFHLGTRIVEKIEKKKA